MRSTTFTIFFLLASICFAQTKIAIPPAKVDLAKLNRYQLKDAEKSWKTKDKWKGKKVKELRRFVKKHTKLSAVELENYTTVIGGLDSAELSSFHHQLLALQDSVSYDPDNRIKEQAKSVSKIDEEALITASEQHMEESADFAKMKQAAAEIKQVRAAADSLRHTSDSTFLASTRNTLRAASSQPLDSSAFTKDSLQARYDVNIALDSAHRLQPSLDSAFLGNAFAQQQDKLATKAPSKWPVEDYEAYQGALSQDSLLSAAIEQKLTQLVEKKTKGLGLEDVSQYTPKTTTAQYIPSLENFDFKKPELPEEKVASAMLAAKKDRKVKELQKSLGLREVDEEEKKSFSDRLELGGFVEYKPSERLLDITPLLTYGISDRLNVGVGYYTSTPIGKGNDQIPVKGWRVFTELLIYKSFYLHGESEWLRSVERHENNRQIRERNTYIGLGKRISYGKMTSSILLLYNFAAPTYLQPQQFSIRFGITRSK